MKTQLCTHLDDVQLRDEEALIQRPEEGSQEECFHFDHEWHEKHAGELHRASGIFPVVLVRPLQQNTVQPYINALCSTALHMFLWEISCAPADGLLRDTTGV